MYDILMNNILSLKIPFLSISNLSKMVSRVEEAMKKKQQQQQQQEVNKAKETYQQHQQKQIVQCNKGKTSKFKRSIYNLQEDGASSAIFFLACIANSTSYVSI